MNIVIYPDPVLRQRAKPLTEINKEVYRQVEEMQELMYQAQGIGLAAPQVGWSAASFISQYYFHTIMQLKLFLGLFASVLLLFQSCPFAFSQSQLENQILDYDDSMVNQLNQAKLGALQIPFIQNNGQTDSKVKFYASMFSGTAFVADDELTYVVQKNDTALVVKEKFLSKYDPEPTGLEKSQASVSYFKGEQENWQSDVPTFNSVSLGMLWDFINVNLVGHGNNVEKIYLVNPGGNVNDIRMRVDGANSLSMSEDGELIIDIDSGELSMTEPVAFQVIDGLRKDIPISYTIDDTRYGFLVGKYDHSKLLIIDPLLSSTYLGGSDSDESNSIVVDSSGHVFVTGFTYSTNFPTTTGVLDLTHTRDADVFVSRFDKELTTLQASTFIGGSNMENAMSIVVDSLDSVYVTGYTTSSDYPITLGSYDQTHNGSGSDIGSLGDVFVSKLSNDLTQLTASTFIGGDDSDGAYGMILDSSNNVYITGQTNSANFPITGGAVDSTRVGMEAFVAKLNSDLTSLSASTFLGGTGQEGAYSIVLDSGDNVYVTGWTSSVDFPTTSGAYSVVFGGGSFDAFVSKLNSSFTTLVKSTYLGGNDYDQGRSLHIDQSGNVFVVGETFSSNYPTISGSYDVSYNAGRDVFITKLDETFSVITKSTFLGGADYDNVRAILIDQLGYVYVGGYTYSDDFPTTTNALDTIHGIGDVADAFITKFDNNLTQPSESTFLGSSSSVSSLTLDSSGNLYASGSAGSGFPTTLNSYDPTWDFTGSDAFVSKFSNLILGIPSSPTGLTATSVSSSQINLSWTAPSGTIAGYHIERESPTGNGFEILVEDTGNTDTTYSDTGLDPDTEYNFRVSAINGVGTSDASNEASATTDAETDSFTLSASGTAEIKKDVTKGDILFAKDTYDITVEISADIDSVNAKGIPTLSNISGMFTIDGQNNPDTYDASFTNLKLKADKMLKKITWTAKEGKGEFKFKTALDFTEKTDQDGKGSNMTKLKIDKATFKNMKIQTSSIDFS